MYVSIYSQDVFLKIRYHLKTSIPKSELTYLLFVTFYLSSAKCYNELQCYLIYYKVNANIIS